MFCRIGCGKRFARHLALGIATARKRGAGSDEREKPVAEKQDVADMIKRHVSRFLGDIYREENLRPRLLCQINVNGSEIFSGGFEVSDDGKKVRFYTDYRDESGAERPVNRQQFAVGGVSQLFTTLLFMAMCRQRGVDIGDDFREHVRPVNVPIRKDLVYVRWHEKVEGEHRVLFQKFDKKIPLTWLMSHLAGLKLTSPPASGGGNVTSMREAMRRCHFRRGADPVYRSDWKLIRCRDRASPPRRVIDDEAPPDPLEGLGGFEEEEEEEEEEVEIDRDLRMRWDMSEEELEAAINRKVISTRNPRLPTEFLSPPPQHYPPCKPQQPKEKRRCRIPTPRPPCPLSRSQVRRMEKHCRSIPAPSDQPDPIQRSRDDQGQPPSYDVAKPPACVGVERSRNGSAGRSYLPPRATEEQAREVAQHFCTFETYPGTFQLQNLSFDILATIIEEKTRENFRDYGERMFGGKLGLQDTRFFKRSDLEQLKGDKSGKEGGAAKDFSLSLGSRGIVSTMNDLCRFADYHVSLYQGRTEDDILSWEQVREMWKAHSVMDDAAEGRVSLSGPTLNKHGKFQGLGWVVQTGKTRTRQIKNGSETVHPKFFSGRGEAWDRSVQVVSFFEERDEVDTSALVLTPRPDSKDVKFYIPYHQLAPSSTSPPSGGELSPGCDDKPYGGGDPPCPPSPHPSPSGRQNGCQASNFGWRKPLRHRGVTVAVVAEGGGLELDRLVRALVASTRRFYEVNHKQHFVHCS